jgi:hypothetical protein
MKRLILSLLVCAARGLCTASAEGVVANIASRSFDVFLRTAAPPTSCRLTFTAMLPARNLRLL